MENPNNTQQLTEQIAQLQQQLAAIQRNTAPRPPRNYRGLKVAATFIGLIAGLFLVIFLCMCAIPLDDDKEMRESSEGVHHALENLRAAGLPTYGDCSDSCPICHPLTWRFHVRMFRISHGL